MRPAGEVRMALLSAAAELATPERGPTLAELTARIAHDMPLGGDVVLNTVKNMRRHGALRIVRTRRVSHSTRPVAEYAPADPSDECALGCGFVDLAAAWGGHLPTSTNIQSIFKD